MNSLDPQQLANINSSRSYIGSTQNLIRRKSDLVRDLNDKKEKLIESINIELGACTSAESIMYSRTTISSDKHSHNRLEEYNNYLKDQHDRGSDLIGQINAAKNFEQLNRVEDTILNPYLRTVKSTCDTYARQSTYDVPVQSFAAPYAPVNVVRAAPVYPASPTMVRVQPVNVVRVQPVNMVRAAPASPTMVRVQPVNMVRAAPASPTMVRVQPVRSVPVNMVRAAPASPTMVRVQPVNVVRAAPVNVIRAPPIPYRPAYQATVTHDYMSGAHNTITVKQGTVVTVLKEDGDWNWVKTPDGVTGYVSRHYLR